VIFCRIQGSGESKAVRSVALCAGTGRQMSDECSSDTLCCNYATIHRSCFLFKRALPNELNVLSITSSFCSPGTSMLNALKKEEEQNYHPMIIHRSQSLIGKK
jgi:hypothetical protein